MKKKGWGLPAREVLVGARGGAGVGVVDTSEVEGELGLRERERERETFKLGAPTP